MSKKSMVCKGSLMIGSGCGNCERCKREMSSMREALQRYDEPEKVDNLIVNQLEQCSSGRESSRLYTILNTHTGDTQVVIEKSLVKRMPATEMQEARRIYNDLTHKSGRRAWDLDDLVGA